MQLVPILDPIDFVVKITDGGWLGLTSEFHAITPLFKLPQSQLSLTKLTDSSDNYFEVRLKVPEKLKSELVVFSCNDLFSNCGKAPVMMLSSSENLLLDVKSLLAAARSSPLFDRVVKGDPVLSKKLQNTLRIEQQEIMERLTRPGMAASISRDEHAMLFGTNRQKIVTIAKSKYSLRQVKAYQKQKEDARRKARTTTTDTARTSWLFKAPREFRTILELETPFTGLENTKAGVDFMAMEDKTTLSAYLHLNPIEAEVNSTFPLNVNCKVLTPAPNRLELNGTLLLRDEVFGINGNVDLIGSLPLQVLITLIPQANSVPSTFQYNIETTLNGYGLVGSLSYSNRLTHFSGNAKANDKLNWEIRFKVDPPNPDQTFLLHAVANSATDIMHLDIECQSNIPQLEHPRFGLTYRCKTFYPEDSSLLYGTINYVELANMVGMLNISIPNKSLNFTGVRFQSETNRYAPYMVISESGP
ncbi:hypothetical protein D910_12019 [Dendroctonus ponderosae]|uniref:Uncharacterized protein n=1 Tax=Dendroctonus ponderosae TaxID=77166 RepID=U4UWU2_DENPD|nr:hypothetical protein D910_12019 [Dendroctonus ponderosae]